MSDSFERKLRYGYAEIIHGFSIKTIEKDTLYIKHFSSLDNLEIDFLYLEHYNAATGKGYPTEKDRLIQLEKDELWSPGDDNNLNGVSEYIKSLNIGKKKAFLKKDIDSINEQIKEQQLLYDDLKTKRESLIGATAEKFSRRIIDAHLMYKSFYTDKELKNLYYDKKVFDELEIEELNELFRVYNSAMESFSELNIKRIALSPIFQNAFSLCETAYEFYGKPVCYLTNFQTTLIAFGGYYKNILTSEHRPPVELQTDPEKFEEWFTSKSNVEQMLDKNVKTEDANVSVMGATKEDLKNWGYEQQGISLAKATKEAGGVLDKEQLMKFYGVG